MFSPVSKHSFLFHVGGAILGREGCFSLSGLRLRVCLLRLEVDLGSVLESELGQKWRYGVLKVCIG